MPDRPRVASWPHWYAPNPYLTLLYAALDRHGIEHRPHVPLAPRSFSGADRQADLLHLHWLYALLRFRLDGRPARRLRGVAEGRALLEAVGATGVPIVWTLHNVGPHDGYRWRERPTYEALYHGADLVVFHSESGRAQADGRFGTRTGDCVIVPHGNFVGAFPEPGPRGAARRAAGAGEGDRLLVCVGQIRGYKGYDVAIEAVRRLGRGYRLVVAGRPIDAAVRRCEQLAREAPNVGLLTRELTAQEVSDLLGAADGVLLPYRAITGSGALLHALTAGRGVVATDLPYFREILSGEPEAGELVTPDDPDALADGIGRFFEAGPGVRDAAAARLAARFAWDDTVAPLAEWILARHGGG